METLSDNDACEDQISFEDNIRNDTIALLGALKQHALDCDESGAWMSVLFNAYCVCINYNSMKTSHYHTLLDVSRQPEKCYIRMHVF